MLKIFLSLISMLMILDIVSGQEGAKQEYNPYVFRHVQLPFKSRNYAQDWFGADVAYIQSPFAATAKPQRFQDPIKLPTVRPFIVKWSDLDDTHVNDENLWNFEKRIDSKLWWPDKK
uniref:Uncharacterized protein n=1 Tax=Acrobeloides nanus TaxID=290746 RepID=A0A914EF95_9BILA